MMFPYRIFGIALTGVLLLSSSDCLPIFHFCRVHEASFTKVRKAFHGPQGQQHTLKRTISTRNSLGLKQHEWVRYNSESHATVFCWCKDTEHICEYLHNQLK